MNSDQHLKIKLFSIFILFSTLYLIILFINKSLIAFGDISIIYRWEQLFRAFQFPYDNFTNFGKPNILLGNAVYNLLIYIIYLMTHDVALAHKLLLIIIFSFIGYLTCKLLRQHAGSHLNKNHNLLIYLLPSLLNMFNPFIIHRFLIGHNTILLGYPFFILAITSLLKIGKSDKVKDLILFIVTTYALLIINPHYFYMFFLSCIVYAICYLTYSRKTGGFYQKLSLILEVVLVPVIAALPFLLHEKLIGNESYIMRKEEIGLYNVIFIQEFFKNPILTVSLTSFFILEAFILAGFIKLYGRINKCTEDLNEKFFFVLFVFGLLLLVFSLEPMKIVYVILFEYLPYFWIFRDAGKFFVFPILSSVYMFHFIISKLSLEKEFRYHFNAGKMPKLVFSIIILICIYLTSSWMYMNSGIQFVNIPYYYDELYNTLYSDPSEYKILYIPPATWAANYSWAKKAFLDFTISQQAKQTLGLPTEAELTLADQFLRWMLSKLYYYPNENWQPLLRYLGVKYVILRGDVILPQNRNDFRIFNPTLMNNIKSTITHLSNDTYQVGNITIIKLKNYYPPIITSQKLAYLIGDKDLLLDLANLDFCFECAFLIYPDNLGSDKMIQPPEHVISADPTREAFLATFADGYLIKPYKWADYTVNAVSTWTYGDLLWYLIPGELSSSPEKYALTTGKTRIVLPLRITHSSSYYNVYVKALAGNYSDLGQIRVTIGNTSKLVDFLVNMTGLAYRWIKVGTFYINDNDKLIIDNVRGLSSISLIKIIPLDEENCSFVEKDFNFTIVLDNDSFMYSEPTSNHFFAKIFIPKASEYYIYAAYDYDNASRYINAFIDGKVLNLINIKGGNQYAIQPVYLNSGEHILEIKGNISNIKAVVLTSDKSFLEHFNNKQEVLIDKGILPEFKIRLSDDVEKKKAVTLTLSYNKGWVLCASSSCIEPIVALSAFNGYIINEKQLIQQAVIYYRGTYYILLGIFIQLLLFFIPVIISKNRNKNGGNGNERCCSADW